MTEPFVSSRFIIREAPAAYPFYDLILRDTQGPVFDLNVDMESYDGHVYLRFEHIEEMARTIGMCTKAEHDKLLALLKEANEKLSRLPEAQEELKSGLNDLTNRFLDNLNNEPIKPSVGLKEPESLDSLIEEAKREAKRPLKF